MADVLVSPRMRRRCRVPCGMARFMVSNFPLALNPDDRWIDIIIDPIVRCQPKLCFPLPLLLSQTYHMIPMQGPFLLHTQDPVPPLPRSSANQRLDLHLPCPPTTLLLHS